MGNVRVVGCIVLDGHTQHVFWAGKYGILPEMLRSKDLAKANGLVQMTTFFAIIFGTALAGPLKDWLAPAQEAVQEAAQSANADLTGDLWKASLVCMGCRRLWMVCQFDVAQNTTG